MLVIPAAENARRMHELQLADDEVAAPALRRDIPA
jgi:hypothetical protein